MDGKTLPSDPFRYEDMTREQLIDHCKAYSAAVHQLARKCTLLMAERSIIRSDLAGIER